MIDAEFLQIFLDEAFEILERWEAIGLKIETDPSFENLNDLFRSAHNLKGSSKSVGLSAYGEFVHHVEDLLTKLKKQELEVTTEVVTTILESQKFLFEWTSELKTNPSYIPKDNGIRACITRLLSNQGTKQVEKTASSASTGLTFFDDEKSSDLTESNGDAQNNKDLGTILIENGKVTQIQIEEAIRIQNQKLGEILVEKGMTSPESIQSALEQQKKSGKVSDETIRVSLRKLDTLIRLIGELSIQHSIVRAAKDNGELVNSKIIEAINLSHKVIQDLQFEAMSLRMQPLENLFQRMERVCRDVAKAQNKNVRVVLKGIDVELDKTVIERMKDPLVHILRNAVDHGIEPAAERAVASKSEIATITIEGIQTAANVSIIITDDGKGLNEEKIVKKAIEKGLIPSTAKPTSSEIQQMIFLPGFSTADKVTDVSGRGVGMDVVKRAVDDLGGQIFIASKLGTGTEFQITLPSTLSILDAIIVSVHDVLYALPIQDVDEVIYLKDSHVEATPIDGRMMNSRGRIMPVERLSDYLPSARHTDGAADSIAIVSGHKQTKIAFEVDKIVGQQQIVVRQLEDDLAKVPGFSGATILANGEPSMIVNLQHVVESYLSNVKIAS